MLRELSTVNQDALKLTRLYETHVRLKAETIEKLEREIAELGRQIHSSPGWAPGGSGENPTATGG